MGTEDHAKGGVLIHVRNCRIYRQQRCHSDHLRGFKKAGVPGIRLGWYLHHQGRRGQGRAELVNALAHLPLIMEETTKLDRKVEKLAHRFYHARDFLYLGRGMSYPIALEGALKLKELSYIHAEGYPAGEMKHGPIALIDENVPVVVLAPRDRHFDKVVSNMEEVIPRGGRVIVICTEGDHEITRKADASIAIPHVPEDLLPLVLSVPLQQLTYHIAVLKGTDVDQRVIWRRALPLSDSGKGMPNRINRLY